MDTLVEHARTELELLGVEPAVVGSLVAVVGAYASSRPTPQQHERLVPMLVELLGRRPLSPLTANPAEWVDRSVSAGGPLWQNRRDPRAMSADGGRTYRLSDDPQSQVHRSAPPRGWVLALRERDGLSEDDAVAAVWEYLDAGGMTGIDVEMLDALPAGALRRDYLEQRWGQLGGAVALLMYGDRQLGGAVQPGGDGGMRAVLASAA